ncbi:hypothetical protein DOTSEDRAFT_68845 [Dothistroma septosporum NZE10]|uniref:PHD-type domain-containing protein n=1 Tax=Dothistroma septosporum (strain NZE10 / CBS 128990) TaxID=675120 RepID=N1Q537_DOTSN|nr:hypothetical protein DOTSEDRAFT_68845 [Dothistroma septosporum NZE10]
MAATALSHASVGDFRSLSRQPERDPDIQATLSDFLTYTEHFPAHLTRALTLIQHQREKAERSIKAVHDDTTAYSILPSITHDRPDPRQLRRDISYALAEAESACRMSVEEAVRLDKECQREAKRLDIVTDKLEAQPLPPSRDPTPEQSALTSPNLKRERRMSGRAEEAHADRQHSLRVPDKAASKAASKLRGRKIMVPGEVLPPPDPNAPLDLPSDWDSPRSTPPLIEEPHLAPGGDREKKDKRGTTPRPRSHTPRPPRSEEERERDRKNPKPRGPRAPGQPGTNAHSAVAGISTSNALLALTEPPPDARPGSKWLPWAKLTEWEMAKLRKRMKKNAIWVPSQTMVRRELKNLGRGIQGKEAARANAERGGDPFLDEGNEGDPTKVIISGEESDQMTAMLGPQIYADDDDADAELINRGMRLNEAKKLKRQRLLEEQALQAQIARETGVDPTAGGKHNSLSPEADKKKRKREGSPIAGPSTETGGENKRPALKKIKIAPPKITQVPLAPAGLSSSQVRKRATTPQASRKTTITIKPGKAVSEEPPNVRSSSRRVSNASMPGDSNGSVDSVEAGPSTTKSGRRSRRPAHNVVITSHDDEDAKVGISKRKAAPKKKKKDSVAPPDQPGSAPVNETGEEYIDPQEPRYCVCGDVSWGTMIACDNDDCEKEWFHLDCVDLTGMPPRRTKWYCPDCRKRLKLGTGTNGLVGRNLGPQVAGR